MCWWRTGWKRCELAAAPRAHHTLADSMLCPRRDVERARAQAKVLHGGRERVHYVSHRWAVSCFRDRKLVPEAVFAR